MSIENGTSPLIFAKKAIRNLNVEKSKQQFTIRFQPALLFEESFFYSEIVRPVFMPLFNVLPSSFASFLLSIDTRK